MASEVKLITSTALICTGKCRIKSATLAAGADAATAAIEDSTAGSGTVFLRLAAVTGTTASWTAADPGGKFVKNGIYAVITGTTPGLSVEFDV